MYLGINSTPSSCRPGLLLQALSSKHAFVVGYLSTYWRSFHFPSEHPGRGSCQLVNYSNLPRHNEYLYVAGEPCQTTTSRFRGQSGTNNHKHVSAWYRTARSRRDTASECGQACTSALVRLSMGYRPNKTHLQSPFPLHHHALLLPERHAFYITALNLQPL